MKSKIDLCNGKKRVDTRILTLKKEVMPPKGKHDYNYIQKNNAELNSGMFIDQYVSSHYFDRIEFSEVECKNSSMFLENAYDTIEKIRRHNDRNSFKIQQCIILFKYYESDESIKKFWEKEASHIFITMIKISDCNKNQLNIIEERITSLFLHYNLTNEEFQIYYTFDFSNLVLLTKNFNCMDYQDLLWQLNFKLFWEGSEENKESDGKIETEQIIKDTITLYGIHQECIRTVGVTEDIDALSLDNRCKNILNNRINVQINLGVLKPSKLYEIYKELCNCFKEHFHINASFGRRDLCIDLFDVEMYHIIKLYIKIKKLSDNPEESSVLLNMKIISSVSGSPQIIQMICDQSSELKTNNKDSDLQFFCDNHSETKHNTITKFAKNISYMVSRYKEIIGNRSRMDVDEIYHSIDELSRNCFSEEFLLCIYYAFYVFLKICIQQENKSSEEELIRFQRDFFSSINMLSHCTMHGEKCFIQAAPFSPLLVDVPPRLLAFYTAIALKIERVLQNEEKQLFSFVFIPGFRDNIHVKPISCGTDTDNRLIAVYIHEKILYNPYRVVCSMVHEIAHYVGDKTRCRNSRLGYIIDAITKYFMYICYPLDGVFDLAEVISPVIKENVLSIISEDEDSERTEECYLSLLYEHLYDSNYLIDDVMDQSECPTGFQMKKPLDKYIIKDNLFYQRLFNMMSRNQYDKHPYPYEKMVYSIILEEIRVNYFDLLLSDDYISTCEQIIGSYREAYADLVLCKLTGITPEQYIDLINKEKINLTSDLDFTLISTDYLYERNIKGDFSLELMLRINAIFCVCFKADSCFPTESSNHESEKILYNMSLDSLVKYLRECEAKINDSIVDDSITKLVNKLSNFSEETFYSMYLEIADYKQQIIDCIDELEGEV